MRSKICGIIIIIAITAIPLNLLTESEARPLKSIRSSLNGLGRNYRVYPSSVTQTETFIARHPTNPDILFASANTINLSTGFVSEGIYVTTDAGLTWSGNDTCLGSPIAFHRGDPGIAIDKQGTFVLVRLGFSPGLYSHFSTDNGRTWSSQKTIATNDQDRATIASDVDSSSANYGRTYATWVRFAPPYPMFFSFTDDGGRSWSSPAQINNPSQRGQGGEVAVGAGGVAYVCWASVIGSSPFTEDSVGIGFSTNGGGSWTVNERAFDMNGISGTLPEKANIRVNGLPRIAVDKSGGSRNGWIYIVTTERNLNPAGSDPDVVLHRSSDGGLNWSSGIRVNQDPVNDGKFQYFPAIHVDDGGGVNVLYYDDRNTSADSAGVYLSRSTDGGTTWNDFTVSDHNFKPQPIGGLGQGYQGDNIGLTSSGSTLWPAWMDNSTGLYQLWTCPIDVTLLGIDENVAPLPREATLRQNYPNPFNPSTTIEYQLLRSNDVSLKVFDLEGKEVATIVEGKQQAGYHSARFETSNLSLSSGIYFYRLMGTGFSVTKSMLLLR